jgi:hypothetical protein
VNSIVGATGGEPQASANRSQNDDVASAIPVGERLVMAVESDTVVHQATPEQSRRP